MLRGIPETMLTTRRVNHASIRIVLAVALLCAIFCALPWPEAAAKSYRITKVDIGARLYQDGSMDVNELRTYSFDGSFSFAYRDMPTGGPVEFGDFQVLEDGRPFHRSDSEEPGTYKIERRSGSNRITWFYSANDERRTFEFRYNARDAIERYDDAAVLYFKFIAEEWTKAQRNITMTLSPPPSVLKGDINAWLHGPLWAEYRIDPDGTIKASCEHLRGGTHLEIRALYPPQAFPGLEIIGRSVRPEIMAAEARAAEEANLRRRVAREEAAARKKRRTLGMKIAGALGALGLGIWFMIFRTYRDKPALPLMLEMDSQIPDKTPPALLSYLLNNRTVAGPALIGTLLDLARRGYIQLREERVEKKSFWGGTKPKSEYHWDLNRKYWEEEGSGLLKFEDRLLQFIFDDLAEGRDSISLEEIQKARRVFMKFFRQWRKHVQTAGKEKGWFDQRSIRGMYYSVAVGLVMVGLTIPGVILFGPKTLILGGAGIIVTILSFFIQHRTAEGETIARRWRAVQKYLKKYEFRGADRQGLLAKISDYLVYGVVLGLSSKFYKEIAEYIPEQEHATYVPWYAYRGTGTGDFSPTAFAEAFSSMVATTTSAMSTASGTGGGASGGGGGGASSGGGGAG